MSRSLMLLALCALAFAWFGMRIFFSAPHAQPAASPGVVEESADASLDRGGRQAPGVRTRIGPPTPRTKRDVLEEFWGAPWEQIAHRFDVEQVGALDEPVDLLPWEDVESEFVEKVLRLPEREVQILADSLRTHGAGGWAGDDFQDRSVNPEGKNLLPADVERLEATRDGFTAEIQALSVTAAKAINRLRMASVDSDFSLRSPLVRPQDAEDTWQRVSARKDRGAYRVGIHTTWKGWVCDIMVDSSRDPELQATLEALRGLRMRRQGEIAALIDAIP